MANGSELLGQCQDLLRVYDGSSAKDLSAAGQCLGKLDGTIAGLEVARGFYMDDVKQPLRPIICWPKYVVTKDQSLRIVVKYLKEHPENLHLGDSTLITVALIYAFPCGKP